jgi:hypothetical protein
MKELSVGELQSAIGTRPHAVAQARLSGAVTHLMELDERFGVELVPCATALMPFAEAMNSLKRRDPTFTDEGFFMGAMEVWSGLHIQESVAIFGPMPAIEPRPVAANLTPEFQRRWTELVRSKLAAPTETVRQLSTLQFSFFNLVSDQNWDGIVIWANYIAELKVPGRDKAADAAAFENPAWNATLAEYCTFIRRVGVTTPMASDPRFTGPFNWLLHDVTADPASARQLGDSGRNSIAA